MTKHLKILASMLTLTLMLTSCVLRSITAKTDSSKPITPLEGYATLDRAPFREAWYGMYFKKDKIGYSHFKIEPAQENYLFKIDSMMRLTALRKTSVFRTKEEVLVKPDLSLVSFKSVSRMNGKDLRSCGRVEEARLVKELTEGGKKVRRMLRPTVKTRVVMEVTMDDEKVRREFPITSNKIYHTSAVSLMPAMKGLKEGAEYSFGIFNPEKNGEEQIKQVVHQVVGGSGPKGAVWKVKHDYGRARVTSWTNRMGLPVLESGPVFTVLEDKQTAKEFEKNTKPGKDLVLDYSLIKVSKPIPNPAGLKRLKVRMSGIDSSLIPKDHRQEVSGVGSVSPSSSILGRLRSFVFDSMIAGWSTIARANEPSRSSSKKDSSGDSAEGFRIHVTSERLESYKEKDTEPLYKNDLNDLKYIPLEKSVHKEIIEQAGKIISSSDSDMVKMTKLVNWTASNIKNRMRDSFSALDVLRAKEGECQSHANLYAAFARSCKIPTRVVTGLVYVEGLGFLYHAWAESYVNGWIAVDPTYNQVPADATHIKISAGGTFGDFHTLMKMVGNVKIEVLEYE